jgi:hypothetical protein
MRERGGEKKGIAAAKSSVARQRCAQRGMKYEVCKGMEVKTRIRWEREVWCGMVGVEPTECNKGLNNDVKIGHHETGYDNNELLLLQCCSRRKLDAINALAAFVSFFLLKIEWPVGSIQPYCSLASSPIRMCQETKTASALIHHNLAHSPIPYKSRLSNSQYVRMPFLFLCCRFIATHPPPP